MRSSMSISLKIFFRSIIYLSIYGILLLLSNLFLMRLYITTNYLAEFHIACLKLGIVGYIVFCLLGYEYINSPKACTIQETVNSIPTSNTKLLSSQFLVLLLLLLIWSTNVIGWIIGKYTQLRIDYSPFFFNAVPSLILDFILPGVIAILVGSLLAQVVTREIAYSIIVISALFCSPVPSRLFASESILGHPVLALFDWFAILAPNTSWVADDIYGASIETYRWFIAAFWILLLAAIIIFVTDKKAKNRIYAFVMVILSLVCCIRFMLRNDDCIVRKDYRSNGVLQAEYSYHIKNPNQEEKSANFSIDKYFIDLTIRSSIKADVLVELKGNELDKYYFTLYHGFLIDRVEDINGNKLEFERDKDYLTVYVPKGTLQVRFIYFGNTGKYFANYQGIALPGYLPYYPVPGFVKLWEPSEMAVIADTDREPAYYEVHVDSNLTVASNLQKESDNTFSGNTEAVSLYGGMLISAETEGITYWYSPIGTRSVNLHGYKETWKELSNRMGETSEFDLTGRTIFLQPMTIMAANSSQEGYVEFSDQIMTAGWTITAEDICKQHLLSILHKEQNTAILFNAFSNYLIIGGNPESYEVTWSSIEILTKYNSSGEIEDLEEWSSYINARDRFAGLFNHKANILGEDFVLKSVYQYLKDPSPDCNQVEFLYNLGE